MRAYVVDELTPEDIAKIKESFEADGQKSAMDDLYWLILPEEQLGEVQREHNPECGPFSMAVEIFEDRVVLDLSVRAACTMYCECLQHGTPGQCAYAIELLDQRMASLEITVFR
jgi:hypothetical protein